MSCEGEVHHGQEDAPVSQFWGAAGKGLVQRLAWAEEQGSIQLILSWGEVSIEGIMPKTLQGLFPGHTYPWVSGIPTMH